jgi:hypothetical protein
VYDFLLTNAKQVVLAVSIAGTLGSMMGVYYTPPESTALKHAFWLALNGFQAATLSPLFFSNPVILYTCGIVSSLSFVGATAK